MPNGISVVLGRCRRSWTWRGAGWHESSRSWQQSWHRHGSSGMRGCCVPRARSSRWVLGGPCCVPAVPAERIPVQALALKEEEKAALAGTLAGLQQSLAQATAELERQRHENASWQQQQQVGAQHRHPDCKPCARASSVDTLCPWHTLHPRSKSPIPVATPSPLPQTLPPSLSPQPHTAALSPPPPAPLGGAARTAGAVGGSRGGPRTRSHSPP